MAARTRPFKHHLIRMQLSLTFMVLIACSTTSIVNDLFIFKRGVERNLLSNAKILSRSLSPAIAFADRHEAGKVLASLRAEPSIVSARVTDRNGKVFARFNALPEQSFMSEDEFSGEGSKFQGGFFILNHPIVEGEEVQGYLFLKSDLSIFAQGYKNYFWIVMAMFSASLLVSFVLVQVTQSSLSRPIVDFAKMAKAITLSGNYSVRMNQDGRHSGIEEIRQLYSEFNAMIEQIQFKDMKIQSANFELELKVAERTKELEEIQKVALENAHEAGMAEIATGILHNIGNITNSINTSAEELARVVSDSKVAGFLRANEILRANLGRLAEFFTEDPKGQVLPEFYLRTGDALRIENEILRDEVQAIAKKISLVKDVVHTQQEYAKKGLFVEQIRLADVIDEILLLQKTSLQRHEIVVVRKYSCLPEVEVQKVKFAHILMNLVKNAKEAMKAQRDERRLTLEIGEVRDGFFLRISDTGEGIAPENMEKIFTHGFTTKRNGHGFGLHFCANAMKEMGGDLRVESAGAGHGASFVLHFKAAAEGLRYA